MIINVVREMDRASAYLGSVFEDGFVHTSPVVAFARERGNEGRVDVDDAIVKILGDRYELQESRHNDELDARIAAGLEDAILERLILTGGTGPHDECGDVGIEGDLEACCIGPARDNQTYFGVELSGRDALEEVVQRAPRSGNENRNGQG